MPTVGRIATPAVLVVALDQATKALANGVGRNNSFVHPMRNSAYSLQIADAGRWTEVAVMVALLVVAVAVMSRLVTSGRIPAWATGLVVGGAAGNVVDRVLFGSVRDYLVVGPVVVNLADVAVLIGIASAYRARATTARTRSPAGLPE
jgi:signal peptidase II